MDDLRDADEVEDWEQAFLDAFPAEYGVIGRAAKAAGVHPNAVRRKRNESQRFSDLMSDAEQKWKDSVRYEVRRRAMEPVMKPVYQRGTLVGYEPQYDNKSLQWVAERLFPEEFHIPTRIEFGSGNTDAINFRLSLGDSPPELESGEED